MNCRFLPAARLWVCPHARLVALGMLGTLGCAIVPPLPRAHAQAVADVVVGDKLQTLTDDLDRIVDQAARAGDHLVEKNGRMLMILTDNLKFHLDDQKTQALDRLSAEAQKALATVDRLVEETRAAQGRMLNLEDYLALDLADTLSFLPLNLSKGKAASLRRIDGYSQIYQPEGVYTFRLIGNAFGPGFVTRVTVNQVEVRALDMRVNKAHTLEFDLPCAAVNGLFLDDRLNRVDLEITSYKAGDSTEGQPYFSHKAKILLLPRFPVEYTLVEHRAERAWSRETYWTAEGRGHIGRRGSVVVSARIPDGCLMLKDTVTVSPTPDWIERENYRVQLYQKNGRVLAWADDLRFTDEDRVVSRTLQFFGAIRQPAVPVSIKVQYRKPTTQIVDHPAFFDSDPESPAPVGRLPFGVSFARMAPNTQSHTLTLKWFNGRKEILTPTRTSAPGIKTDLETLSQFRRLVLTLSWPDR